MQNRCAPINRSRAKGWLSPLLLLSLLFASSSLSACRADEEDPGFARAQRVTHRSQLIGGPTALGEVGDWMIENDQIRLLIQDRTYNRGSGLFGGSLIDADLVRPDQRGNPFGGTGRDSFGELFPAFFLEVIDPEEIVVVNDGSNGKAAVLEVRGVGGEFVTMLRFFNQVMVNAYVPTALADLLDSEIPNSDGDPLVSFTARYILEPGARHVRIESELVNETNTSLAFPTELVRLLGTTLGIDLKGFTVPTGAVVGLGALNNLFVPGLGNDIRFGMEDLYEVPVELPAIPGHVADLMATSGENGVSYGFAMAADEEQSFVAQKPEFYGEREPYDMLFLFHAAGFAGAFTHELPGELGPGEKFTAASYFIVGTGDVASVRDELYHIRQQETVTVTGRILDELSGQPVPALSKLFIYEAAQGAEPCKKTEDSTPYLMNEAQTNNEGYFHFELPPGDYCYRTRAQGPTSDFVPFTVGQKPLELTVRAPSAGLVEAQVVDQNGRPVPAKLTLVGTYEPRPGLLPRQFLFDLSVGESWRTSEFIEYDDDDTAPRRYIESISLAGADGRFSTYVRPGKYTAVISRGTEYDFFEKEIDVKAGQIVRFNAQITRTLDTTGYLSADLHLHAEGSIDSGLDYNTRVISVAAEGVEVAVASDHNYVSDYAPYIYRNRLEPFLRSITGIELTTFEGGHFNAFPIRQDKTQMNRGSIPWQNIPPQVIFDELRTLAPPDTDTIIQINHPRDALLGYFNQYNLDPLTGVADLPVNKPGIEGLDRLTKAVTMPNGPAFAEAYKDEDGKTRYRTTFSYDFDAIEIYNGKRINLLRHFRMPFDKDDMPDDIRAQLTEEQYEALPDQAGIILCDGDEVAYPGGLDDWYNLHNYYRPDGTYRRYTATGNSDSHEAATIGKSEPGSPKNYFWAGHNDPQLLQPSELVEAIQNHHLIVTNGPFINMSVKGEPIGSTVSTTESKVTLDLYAAAVDWVGLDRFKIIANGETVYEGQIQLEDGVWQDSITLDIDGDTWFVMEAEGDNNLFPIVQPSDIPPVSFDQVIGTLAGALGFGDGVEGLSPAEIGEITPLAFTNPIWVIDDADEEGRTEFIPPEPPLARCLDGKLETMEARSAADFVPFGDRRLDAKSVPLHIHQPGPAQGQRGEYRDARTFFEHWGSHSH